MFYPAKVEMICDIVCSHMKEYQSYKLKDSIISKFAGQTSCYATSGVSPNAGSASPCMMNATLPCHTDALHE